MKKFLVVFLIAIIVLIAMPMKTSANTVLKPDITTSRIIILDPAITSLLTRATLSIVSFISDVPGKPFEKAIGFKVGKVTNLIAIININPDIDLTISRPVGLRLRGGALEIYCSKIKIVQLDWEYLSIPEIPFSYFPLLVNAQIVKIEKTGGHEKEINYCNCGGSPKIVEKCFYKIYLNTETDPYTPPTTSNIEIGVMVPIELESLLEQKARDHDYIFIGISAPNAQIETPYANTQIYIWLSQ